MAVVEEGNERSVAAVRRPGTRPAETCATSAPKVTAVRHRLGL